MRRIPTALSISLILCGFAVFSHGATVSTPGVGGLQIEKGQVENSVLILVTGSDGIARRHLLRQTASAVTPGPTGADPTGLAQFATWREDHVETWHAWSRDGGQTWSPARRLERALRLLDGSTLPGDPAPVPVPGLALADDGRLWIVQFRTASLPEFRDALAAIGGGAGVGGATGASVSGSSAGVGTVELLRVFPHNGHIVRMDAGLASHVSSLSFVERVEKYHPSYRLEPELKDWLLSAPAAGSGAPEDEMRVRVMAFEWGPGGKTRIRQAAEALGARVAQWWPSGHILELFVTRDQLRALAAHEEVSWIDRWSAPETDMDLVRNDAGTDWIETNFGYCGQDVGGEVMDAGFDRDHQDFDGRILHHQSNVDSHGTSTFGIVFGNGDRDGDGNAQGTGHMPCVTARKIFADFDFLGDRFVHTEELLLPRAKASFQSNSWGGGRTTAYTSTSSEMDDIIWRLDFAITQSQSNAGDQMSRPQAWAKNIISVGGIRHFGTLDDSDDAWNGGASIGPAADGRIKPDVNYWYDGIFTTTTGSNYTSGFGGTSAATPEVAGVLGLMVQMYADDVWGTNPLGAGVFEKAPHASTIKALLVNNAIQYPFTGTASDLTRTHQGWGRPNLQLAHQRAATSLIVDEEVNLEIGETMLYGVDVSAGETELKITMIYPDPPGTTSASLHRINDVNIKVTSPSGAVYHGNNGLDAGNYSTPGGLPNGVDTVENVFVQNPQTGTWLVEIDAAEVNQDAVLGTPETDVTFALVVTGATVSCTGACGPPTPGEASNPTNGMLTVTGYDTVNDIISLAYGPACSASDHVIEAAELTVANLQSYSWSIRECGLGMTGSYNWDVSGQPQALFFVVVGQDGVDKEGSYGTDGGGIQRPEDPGNVSCPATQNLSLSCGN